MVKYVEVLKKKISRALILFFKVFILIESKGLKKALTIIKHRLFVSTKVHEVLKSFMLNDEERRKQKNFKFNKNIKFSILVPLYNTPEKFFEEMINSVISQTYSNWELCLVDSSDSDYTKIEKKLKEFNDNRIKYKRLKENGGISKNTNECIKMATGDYLALLDHDDILNESALFEIMQAICNENADFIYTDEAVFQSPNINRIKAFNFKSDYALDTLRAVNYICHFTAFKKTLLKEVGLFRPEFDGSQDHDMFLRLTSRAEKIVHIPKILYYWRSHSLSVTSDIDTKAYAIEAGKNAVKENIKNSGYDCQVFSSRANPTMYRIKYEIKNSSLVSIIIPNKNHYQDLKKCIDSILNLSTYKNYEIIIIDNGSNEEALFNYYEELKKNSIFKIYSLDIEFNYSKLNNYAVEHAKGEYYILLNNDIEIITPNWIEEMLMYVQRDDVGIAGAMLYYPNNTIQHAGVVIGLGGVAGHCFIGEGKKTIGYMGRLCYSQNLSAVTAACMMIKASVYKEVGGLDEELKVAYNDIDLCMKVRKAGYLIVWTPYAEAYHYESKTRGYETTLEKRNRFNNEKLKFKTKWHKELEEGDPYYNINLTLDRGDFSLR